MVNLTLINGSIASYQLFHNGMLINVGYFDDSFIMTNLKAGNYTLNVEETWKKQKEPLKLTE